MYYEINERMDAQVISMRAGDKYNVIPNYGELVLALPHDAVPSLKAYLVEVRGQFEHLINEENIELELDICQANKARQVIDKALAIQVATLIQALPNGVIQLSERASELIDTSLNIGVVHVDTERAEIKVSVRGMTEERLDQSVRTVELLTGLTQASCQVVNAYPAWKDEGENYLRRLFERSYENIYRSPAVLRAIHAGLECSILAQKLDSRKLQPKIEMISFGPDIFDAHTPQESLSVSSVQRTWDLFIHILKELSD
jgi:dipeptidase D